MLTGTFAYMGAPQARALACAKNAGDQPVQNAIDVAINTAVNSGLFTCTASMTGYASLDIQDNMQMLTQLGYTVTISGTTMTISW